MASKNGGVIIYVSRVRLLKKPFIEIIPVLFQIEKTFALLIYLQQWLLTRRVFKTPLNIYPADISLFESTIETHEQYVKSVQSLQ